MIIDCSYKKLLSPNALKPHTKNRNTHTKKQVKLLARLIEAHGWRHPIIVSNQSGMIVAGHGRLEAAKLLKLSEVPVDFQDFKDPIAEYQFLVSDNEIAHLAKTDLQAVLADVLNMGPDFDMELLGIPDFCLPEDFKVEKPKDERLNTNFIKCPACEHEFDPKKAKRLKE